MLPLVWLQFALVCDYPRSTVLMMPPALSHFSLEGEDRGKKVNTVEMACLDTDMEVRVSCVWEREGEGRVSNNYGCIHKDFIQQ